MTQTQMSFRLFLLSSLCLCSILLSLVTVTVTVSAASNCPADSINCKTCPNNARSNDIAGIPRLNKAGKITPSSIGAYRMVDCTEDGSSCATYIDDSYGTKSNNQLKQRDMFDRLINYEPANDQDPSNYAWSLVIHVIFAFVLAFLTILCGLGLLIGRYCCFCIKGGTCGKRWPTLRSRHMGFIQNPHTGEYEYPNKERWVVRVYMWIFVFCVFLFIGLGYFEGTNKIAPAFKNVANSPAPLFQTLQNTASPFANLLERLASTEIPKTIRAANDTINTAVNLPLLANNLACIGNIVSDLPNPAYLSDNLTAIGRSIDNIQTSFNVEIPSYTSSLEGAKNAVRDDVNRLADALNRVSANLTAATTALDKTDRAVDDIDTFLATQINNPSDGLPLVIADVNSMNTHLPDKTTQTDPAATDLGRVVANPMADPGATPPPQEINKAGVDTLVTRLREINGNLSATPNLATTANRMDTFNTRLASPQRVRVINAIYYNLTQTQQQIQSVYASIDATSGALTQLKVTIAGTNATFAASKATIGRVNAAVQSTPSLTVFSAELGRVQTTKDTVVPCATNIVAQVNSINVLLVQLPTYFTDVDSTTGNLNRSLDAALIVVNTTNRRLAAMETTRNSINFNQFIIGIDTLQNNLHTNAGILTNDRYINDLTRVKNDTGLNYQVSSEVVALNTSLNGATISSGLITSTRAADNVKNTLISSPNNLTRVANDLDYYANNAVCVSGTTLSTSTACSVSSPCTTPGQTCPLMVKRCRFDQHIQCTSDTTCNIKPGDYCLTDSQRLGGLQIALQNYGTARPSSSSLSSANTSLSDVSDKSKLGTASLKTGIVSAKAAINGVSPTSFINAIGTVQSSLNAENVNVTSQNAQIKQLNGTIDSLRDTLATSQTEVRNLNSSYASIRLSLTDINRAQSVISFIQRTLSIELNNVISQLSLPLLKIERTRDGQHNNLAAMVAYVATILDNFVTYWNDGQDIYSIGDGTSYLNQTESMRDYADQLTTQRNLAYGSAYALARLFNKDDTIEASRTQPGDRIFQNRNGVKYNKQQDGGIRCLTKACIDATVDYYTQSTVATIYKDETGKEDVNANLTVVQFLGLPLLFCFVAALLGLISSFCYRDGKAAAWMSSITSCWIWTLMPIMFILSAITFPIVLLSGDTCMGMEDVGQQFLLGRKDFACTNDARGIGTAQQCILQIDSAAQSNLQAVVNLPELYRGIVGSSCSAGNDAVAAVLESMRPTLSTYPRNKIDSLLNETNLVQPTLREVLRNSAQTSVDSILLTLDDLRGVVGCSQLSTAWHDTKSAVCCDAVTAIYWSIATWYLIAWSMLFCGCGAALLGRKRFGHRLWGDDYDLLTQPDYGMKYNGNPLAVGPNSGELLVIASVASPTEAGSPSPNGFGYVEMQSPPAYMALPSPANDMPSPSGEGQEGQGQGARRPSVSSVDSQVGGASAPVAAAEETHDGFVLPGQTPPSSSPIHGDGDGDAAGASAPGGVSLGDNFQSDYLPSPIAHYRNPSSSPANQATQNQLEPLIDDHEEKQQQRASITQDLTAQPQPEQAQPQQDEANVVVVSE